MCTLKLIDLRFNYTVHDKNCINMLLTVESDEYSLLHKMSLFRVPINNKKRLLINCIITR